MASARRRWDNTTLTALKTHPSLRWYLGRRLGPLGGRRAWFNFFIKPFGASSFASFWRQWNPVYGYYLNLYSYRPLSRIVGRRGAMFATFVVCGFVLHDLPAWVVRRRLPPGATIAFTAFGAGVMISEAVHMDTSRWPVQARAALNAAFLTSGVAIMLGSLRLTGSLGRPQSHSQ